MKNKKNGKLYFFLSIVVGFYLVFSTIFFTFFGNISVDGLIGCAIFLLFFLIYRKSRYFFTKYISSLTKNVYLNFLNLFKLLVSLRKLILGYNKVYLKYFRYTFFALRTVSRTMSVVYKRLSFSLLNKFLINLFLNRLNLKLFFVRSRTNFLPVEFIFRGNCLTEINLLVSFDILFFIL